MLDDKVNTAVYLLYSYTRIRSISRTANVKDEQMKKEANKKGIPLSHEKEMKLAKLLLCFSDTIVRLTNGLCIHLLHLYYS